MAVTNTLLLGASKSAIRGTPSLWNMSVLERPCPSTRTLIVRLRLQGGYAVVTKAVTKAVPHYPPRGC